MSLPDSAEYWFKNPIAYSPNYFRHAKGVDCGSNLVIRTNSKDKKQFLGCSGYPKCKHTEMLIKK